MSHYPNAQCLGPGFVRRLNLTHAAFGMLFDCILYGLPLYIVVSRLLIARMKYRMVIVFGTGELMDMEESYHLLLLIDEKEQLLLSLELPGSSASYLYRQNLEATTNSKKHLPRSLLRKLTHSQHGQKLVRKDFPSVLSCVKAWFD
jgi:hypothetical protein